MIELHIKFLIITVFSFFIIASAVKLDISFLVDVSACVSRQAITYEFHLVKYLANHFKISQDSAHASVLLYGQTSDLAIKFNDFFSVKAFSDALDKLKPKDGNPRLDKAYQVAAEKMFTARSGARPNAAK